jgi:hypothetical protein
MSPKSEQAAALAQHFCIEREQSSARDVELAVREIVNRASIRS